MYSATMWLEFTVDTSSHANAAMVEFVTKIWPPYPNRWTSLLVDADDDDELKDKLNTEFVTYLKDVSPYSDIDNWTMLPPFDGYGWYVGTGGLHDTEWKAVEYGDPQSPTPFEFPYTYNGDPYMATVFVRARFIKLSAQI